MTKSLKQTALDVVTAWNGWQIDPDLDEEVGWEELVKAMDALAAKFDMERGPFPKPK